MCRTLHPPDQENILSSLFLKKNLISFFFFLESSAIGYSLLLECSVRRFSPSVRNTYFSSRLERNLLFHGFFIRCNPGDRVPSRKIHSNSFAFSAFGRIKSKAVWSGGKHPQDRDFNEHCGEQHHGARYSLRDRLLLDKGNQLQCTEQSG